MFCLKMKLGPMCKENKNVLQQMQSKTVEICAVLVALCALVLTFYQARQTNFQNRISNLPSLNFNVEYGDEFAKITFINRGNGPAIIYALEFHDEGGIIPIEGMEGVLKRRVPFLPNAKVQYETITRYRTVKASEEFLLTRFYKLITSEDSDVIKDYIENLDLIVCYKSFYGDYFSTAIGTPNIKEGSCAKEQDELNNGFRWPWEVRITEDLFISHK